MFIEMKLRQPGVRPPVARDVNDILVMRVQQRLTHVRAIHLELGDELALEALDQHRVESEN